MAYKYGLVVDLGLSGSRIQVYRWDDSTKDSRPPQVAQEPGWSKKVSPGVSSYATKPSTVWKHHYRDLFRFAEQIVPKAQHAETPVYVLLTAGMRLLPERQRQALLAATCKGLRKGPFYVGPDCAEHVQTIDGATEGVFGWLALNHLMGLLAGDARLIGFMDMGGALTQIAFVPAPEEVAKHDEDLATVALRNTDGLTSTWRVFVETWLGFGANRARDRYLQALVSAAAPRGHKTPVWDPCMPAGAVLEKVAVGRKSYTVKGTGDYEACQREIYPLLMKHLPCSDTPCLFNGVHLPKMDFEKDRFVGVSEYWYTANDVFHSGGEYNFHLFNAAVKDFCASDWTAVVDKSAQGAFLGLPESFLLTACFKASWVLNILHEGFGLPRLGLDVPDTGKLPESLDTEKVHVPFKLADSVDGKELSWTLGKMLLVASAQVPGDGAVGLVPSAISQKALGDDSDFSDDEALGSSHSLLSVAVLLLLLWCIVSFGRSQLAHLYRFSRGKSSVRAHLGTFTKGCPRFIKPYISKVVSYMDAQDHEVISMDLEEGNLQTLPPFGASVLRTRLAMNVADAEPNFLNKPFLAPKISSFDTLHRLSSLNSLSRKK